MKTTRFRDLLVHLVPRKVDEHTWRPGAVIEDPANKEVSYVSVDVEVKSEDHANLTMLLEAHARIQTDTWRNLPSNLEHTETTAKLRSTVASPHK
ncbi:hypothetical protein SAMN05216303_102815 [Rhodoferax sp. OV413]|uniref:hypothetical protein n=1 Tax=Rhodoferax sp. OV413 TaxID=1855285 RepID=UPI00088C80FD|nr:hypothetical protein [Rhodoferax sp. OV413]SDO96779.1 hypothetical protein SAMN05216303_102815 [Rhodoferax sp. OV413]